MNTFFPLSSAINRETGLIIQAMDARMEKIKDKIASESYLKSITVLVLKTLGLAAGLATIASLPLAAITFTAVPLMIALSCLTVAITCLVIGMFIDPRNPGELIVKEHWKTLFAALREGVGAKIIETSQELAIQQRQRAAAFKSCLGTLSPSEIESFFHKTCMVGYLLVSLDHLSKNEIDKSQENAKTALSYFKLSGFPEEASHFGKAICSYPAEMRQLIDTQPPGKGLLALDYLLVLKRKALSLEE